jgi:signal transduction histidine kinase
VRGTTTATNQTSSMDMTRACPAALAALSQYTAQRAKTLVVAELDDEGNIRCANAALARVAGRDLVGARIHELIAPRQWATVDSVLARSEPGWQQLLLGVAPDARGVPLDFAVSLYRLGRGWLLAAEPADDTINMVNTRLLALNDELAAAQRRILRQHAELERQNERLRELDQVKDALLANVSHDLRTPLTAILGYAELMTRRGGLSDKHARSAAVIERNARRLLRLVNDLLLLAQAQAGRLELECEPVDLRDLLAEVYELGRPLAEQGRLTLRLDLPAAGTAIVSGDRLRLGQLLENLVANALKFTPAGGEVVVRARGEDDGAQLEVRDDGPGIAPEDQSRLYEAFVRGEHTGSPGTGLGLAIVRTVADAHGAQIALHSAGTGTRFTVTFPALS